MISGKRPDGLSEAFYRELVSESRVKDAEITELRALVDALRKKLEVLESELRAPRIIDGYTIFVGETALIDETTGQLTSTLITP